jgi:hypothetical protein
VEIMGLKVKIPMKLQVDNQGVWELVNNWSVGGRTQHAATKTMFLHELKEWGLLVIEYLPESQMFADVLTKNLQGLLFEKHLKQYVRDDESKEAERQQAGEAAGMKKNGTSEDSIREPRIGYEAQDRLNHVCLLSLGNPVDGNQGRNCSDQKDGKTGVKGLAKSYGDVEDKVLNDVMDGKAQMFDMGWVKNG